MDRRQFLQLAGGLAAVAAAPGALSACAPSSDPHRYESLVPELFGPLPDPPAHAGVLIIGTGFGGAVSAFRLASAGIDTTVLERGSRWPTDPHREIFANDVTPDGRGFWHRTSFTNAARLPQFFDDFGGVLDVTSFDGLDVWHGACVGGGSVVYTGATVAPEKPFFDDVFRGLISYDEMATTYYPRAMQRLGASPMPEDIYAHESFRHSRLWDEQVRTAGYEPQRLAGAWNWDVIRDEIAGRARASATIGETNLGNANGAKITLEQTYLGRAEATGRARVFPGHRVVAIGEDRGRYTVDVEKLRPTGEVIGRRVLTCDRLILGAGTIGTNQLLLKARDRGDLGRLDEHVGTGFGTNGDGGLFRFPAATGSTQAAPSASRIVDTSGLPVSLESWFMQPPLANGLTTSLGMVLTAERGQLDYQRGSDSLRLAMPTRDQAPVIQALAAVHDRIAGANGQLSGVWPLIPTVNASFTAHPLGGAVLGSVTDAFGRVKGHPGLYVMDGSLLPGSVGTANPSLTITALCERNFDDLLRDW